MPTVKDVPAAEFIEAFSAFLKGKKEFTPPDWADHVTTGHHKELAPYNPDWWHIRCASILRHVYIRGKVGVGKLTKVYGGRKRRGSRPCVFSRGSASIIRKALLQLENAGFVEKIKKDDEGGEYTGRRVTREGQRHLNQIADKVFTNLKKAPPFP